MIQDAIWYIALTGMGLVAVGFIYVISQAGKSADAAATSKSAHTSNVLRRWLFGALLVIFVTGSYATLHRFPIPSQDASLDAKQVVDVVGQQWSWAINPATVQAGTPVEFRISSRDVNHGFAIYAPDGRIAIEAQAMPGFTNKLLYTFAAPGTYKVMCLEYCGLGHAPMTSQIQVVAARGD
ncbi:MAG: cytochrome oxidase [Proteobacteria bacterium]|nr:cytochrome oxidase [Pseudomonadota bacterium]